MAGLAPTRLGGRTELGSGDVIVWSVADGRRGRRWRESDTHEGVVRRTILAETEPDGGLHRLEIASAAGLLTLHPDAAGTTLHGNTVTPTGIRHLSIDWGPDRAILVEQSPAASAIAVGILGRGLAIGEQRRVAVVRIDDALVPGVGRLTVARLEDRVWRLSDPDPAHIAPGTQPEADGRIVLDEGGLIVGAGQTRWPLEI